MLKISMVQANGEEDEYLQSQLQWCWCSYPDRNHPGLERKEYNYKISLRKIYHSLEHRPETFH